MEHLFTAWPGIEPALRAAPGLLVLLDFDGTLAPLVSHADLAHLPETTKQALTALGEAPTVRVAIVSGRAAANVREKTGLPHLDYIGNHGREHLRPGAAAAERDERTVQAMTRLARALDEDLRDIPGAWVENKGLTLAVHYRQVAAERQAEARNRIQAISGHFAGKIHVGEGKCVFDIVPADGSSKGTAVMALWQEYGGRAAYLPVYCGDDTTDETAFLALPDEALTVVVGGKSKQSAARYRVDDPQQVAELLERLTVIRRS